MRARAVVNLALFAALIALALLAWRRPGLTPPVAPRPIATLKAEDVRSVTITRPDQPDILLEKDQGRWWIRAPYAAPADVNRVDMVLRILTEQSEGALTVAEADLARLGLAPPKASLGVNDLDFDFGDNHPLDARRYVKIGAEVHLLIDTVYYLLVGNAAEYLDKALVDPGSELKTIALPDRVLTRGEMAWSDSSPKPLSADAVQATVAAWRDVRAYNVRTRGDAPATGTITLTAVDGATRQYEIVGTEPALVLARADLGVEYEIDATEADALLGRAKPAQPVVAPAADPTVAPSAPAPAP